MILREHILSKKLTYIKLKIVLCSHQKIHELKNLSPQLPTLDSLIEHDSYGRETCRKKQTQNIYYYNYLCEKFDDSSKKFDNKKNSLEPI